MDIKKAKIIKTTKPFALWDIALFAVLAIIIVLLFVFSLNTAKEGDTVRVFVGNDWFEDYSIDTNGSYDITSSDGTVLMILVIKDKTVWVKESTCPDKICELSKIRYSPQQIICLPNKVYISIIGKSDIDIIVGNS